jgi:1-phosphatidylinositol-3-phosphate 5-kinase
MLSFLQNIIVGGGGTTSSTHVEENSEEEEEDFSTSNRKVHHQQAKTDDQIANELLEQFPRYGSFASSLQQQESVHAAVMASFGTNNNDITSASYYRSNNNLLVLQNSDDEESDNPNTRTILGSVGGEVTDNVGGTITTTTSTTATTTTTVTADAPVPTTTTTTSTSVASAPVGVQDRIIFAYRPPPFLWKDLEELEKKNIQRYGDIRNNTSHNNLLNLQQDPTAHTTATTITTTTTHNNTTSTTHPATTSRTSITTGDSSRSNTYYATSTAATATTVSSSSSAAQYSNIGWEVDEMDVWTRGNNPTISITGDVTTTATITNPSSLSTGSTATLKKRNDGTYDYNNDMNKSTAQQQQNSGTLLNEETITTKEHWMPDKLCKHCYSCEIPFTVFRRRHHCRLCGQVFCSNCSAYFVHTTLLDQQQEGEQMNATNTATYPTVRACQMCYEQVSLSNSKTANMDGVTTTTTAITSTTNNIRDSSSSSKEVVPQETKQPIDGLKVERTSSSLPLSDLLLLNQEQHGHAHIPTKATILSESFLPIGKSSLVENDEAAAAVFCRSVDSEKVEEQDPPRLIYPPQHQQLLNNKKQPLLPHPKKVLVGPPTVKTQPLGQAAAKHLERICYEMLQKEAPLLWMEQSTQEDREEWVNTLLTLATRCCATVQPNVRGGDLLDIRPYSKVKVIPGGCRTESAYISGIVFPKNINHKSMAREILHPKVMLLSGGIEFSRTEHRITSLQTLLEQEERYMEILVTKIVGLQPDLLLVGRAVSRRAQELLLKANVVLIQHVKPSLMARIARQTGAKILSSTDHVITQPGTYVLGKCRRFRLVTFRCHNWEKQQQQLQQQQKQTTTDSNNSQDAVRRQVNSAGDGRAIPHHEKQAILAAQLLGDSVVDGIQAVRSGLAKRGIARTYVMMEGCPKQLGCTMVLRGASKPALRQAKAVLSFLTNVAYNLKLEISYLRDRCVSLPDITATKDQQPKLQSSSLCVDYGQPPPGRKLRPWNGSSSGTDGSSFSSSVRPQSGDITALDHQSILMTSLWMIDKTQCCPAEVKGISYYTRQDISLGQFLHESCFNLNLRCHNASCKKTVLEHTLSFAHGDGMINVSCETMESPLPPRPLDSGADQQQAPQALMTEKTKHLYNPIATWTYCNNCSKVVTPLVFISDDTWNYSFGKFLEVYFYNRDAIINSPEHGCCCPAQTSATLYFGCERLAARFTYEKVCPFGVFIRRSLPFDEAFHRNNTLRHLEKITNISSALFLRFDKHIEKVSREARQLLGSAANKPEHLQQVLSELNSIGGEVDRATKTLHEKIASITSKFYSDELTLGQDGFFRNENFYRFPWHVRRYLFLLASAWNERLSAIGEALTSMKKLAAETSAKQLGIHSDGYGNAEDVIESIRRLKELQKGQRVYSQYNTMDMSLRTDYNSDKSDGEYFLSNKTKRSVRRAALKTSDYDYHDDVDDAVQEDLDYDDLDSDDDGPDSDGNFPENSIDADVLASRRRLDNRLGKKTHVTKSLGSRRHRDDFSEPHHIAPDYSYDIETRTLSDQDSKGKSVSTAGGAVKNAITRFFNRLAQSNDPYVVDLNELAHGMPRLEPGVGGVVVPVSENQPSTVIAYSLSSVEYAAKFRGYLKGDTKGLGDDEGDLQQPRRRGFNKNLLDLHISMDKKDIEKRMLFKLKTHIKHTFRDIDSKRQIQSKFICTSYWATQFHAVRQAFFLTDTSDLDTNHQGEFDCGEKRFVRSLLESQKWDASGGKSGATFARTADGRFVVKCISRTELQMFLDNAVSYFEYLSKAFFHGLPTVLCKILGVYQIGYHNRITGRRSMEQIVVMPNIFYGRNVSVTFDLKGSLRGRHTKIKEKITDKSESVSQAGSSAKDAHVSYGSESDDDNQSSTDGSIEEKEDAPSKEESKRISTQMSAHKNSQASSIVYLDGDFLDFTGGRPLPMDDKSKALFNMSICNDTLFLSIINVLDYSILVGIDEEKMELVVGIIDFMRQYDILKQMERVGKSIPMVVGSEAPTIIQPPLYKARFTAAMDKYFFSVPTKWTTI